ncbi:hypothetical protein SAMN04488128_101201 [Chitinophaga eiseniae]|uniref:PQQ-like domain-containing protein n=1 Tax=Chitinophaga eiseniae TaxID=634771 RepID=A0A1T4KLS6_9BACT|nr:hypothetical protein [Chitinophaga eiseniae]SJZ43356.1 hypothetical protein SAMN04488128_101201 [Chitinophaga eiseniae]
MKAIITLLKTLLFPHYLSGSAVNYHDGLLYVIGDDANQLLVLDSNYHEINTVTLFPKRTWCSSSLVLHAEYCISGRVLMAECKIENVGKAGV